MENSKKYSTFIVFILFVLGSFAQPKSTDKITYDGISYYLHKIGKSESLYAISKMYNTDIEDIKKANPDLDNNFKKGKTLKIPIFEPDFRYHWVENGETFFSIAKKYQLSQDEISTNNPAVASNLKAGVLLKLPKTSAVAQTEIEFEPDEKTNKGDVTSVIKYVNNPCEQFNYTGQKLKVALLLPLFANQNQNMTISGNEADKTIKYYQNSKLFIEYYEGTLLALDSLRKLGISIDLHVFDTQNNVTKVKEIANLPIFSEMDLIIGPIFSTNIKALATEIAGKNINIVSPLDSKDSLVYSIPNLFQVNSSEDLRFYRTMDYINKINNANIIFVHGENQAEAQLVEDLKKYLKTLNDTLTLQQINFRKSSEVYKLQTLLDRNKTNVVVCTSTEEVLVTNLLNRLMTVADRYLISVFGSRRWETFSNMDLLYYSQLNIHYHSNTFFDNQTDAANEFINKFDNIYGYQPSEYALHGFDVMFYFGNILKKYGKNFNACLENEKEEIDGLHTGFLFKKLNTTSGYENHSVYIVRYNEQFHLRKMDTKRSIVTIFGTQE